MGKESRAAIAAGIAILFWASSFPGIKVGLDGYSPFELASLRFVTASLALAAAAYLSGSRIPRRADLLLIACLGLIGVSTYHLMLNFGESRANANIAAFLTNVAPLFTAIIAWRHLRENVDLLMWLGIGLSLGGVFILFDVSKDAFGSIVGPTLLLGAALCWSLFFVLQKPLLRRYTPFEVTCYAVWAGTIPFLAEFPDAVSKTSAASPASIFAALYLGIGPTTLAYLCWAHVLSRMPASRASLLTYLTPVVSIVISLAWIGERPDAAFLSGAALVLSGVFIGSGRGAVELRRLGQRLRRARKGRSNPPQAEG